MSEVFTFVDATHMISKASLWEERNKIIQEKIEELLQRIEKQKKEGQIKRTA